MANLKIRITTRQEGLRRGGVAHTGTQIHPLARFTAEQIGQIRSEPRLSAELVEEGPEGQLLVHPWREGPALQDLLNHSANQVKEDDRPRRPVSTDADPTRLEKRVAELEAAVASLKAAMESLQADFAKQLKALAKQLADGKSVTAGK